jgi:hypothetical protein
MNNTLMDVHGAGSQRSDPKSGDPGDYPAYFGPQGDVQYVYNFVRCVRNITPAGLDEQGDTRDGKILIWPNPAENCIWLSGAGLSGIMLMTITDLTGAIMLKSEVNPTDGATIVVPVQQWPAGIYFICLAGNDEVRWGRFVRK